MNANELANYIEDEYLNGMECEHGFLVFENGGCPNEGCKRQDFYKAVTMLRQQQAEIEALKGLLEAYRDDNRTSESFDRTASHMAGEYVAHSNCNGFCGEYECKENKTNCLRKAQEK